MRLVLLIGLICIGCYVWGTKETHLARALGDRLGSKVSIQSCSVKHFDTLVIKNLTLFDPSGNPALKLSSVEVQLSWKDLLKSPMPIRHLVLDNAELFAEAGAYFILQPYPNKKQWVVDETAIHSSIGTIALYNLGGIQGASIGSISRMIVKELLNYRSPKKHLLSPKGREKVVPEMHESLDHIRHHLHAF